MTDQEPEPLPGMPIPPKPARWVDVTIEGTIPSLRTQDVFPDGCPNPSGFWNAETLAIHLGLEYHSAEELLRDWGLENELAVTLADDVGNRVVVKFGRRG